jgi:hypothetical protein
MHLCQCNGSSEDDITDAAIKLKDRVLAAGTIASAIEIVFAEIHKDDEPGRIRCGNCTTHIRSALVDLQLRPEFERHASRAEADKICDHCATCTGCHITFDYSPLN